MMKLTIYLISSAPRTNNNLIQNIIKTIKNPNLFIFFGGFKISADNLHINVSYNRQEKQLLSSKNVKISVIYGI